MLRELAQITNPSLRERMERGLVGVGGLSVKLLFAVKARL